MSNSGNLELPQETRQDLDAGKPRGQRSGPADSSAAALQAPQPCLL